MHFIIHLFFLFPLKYVYHRHSFYDIIRLVAAAQTTMTVCIAALYHPSTVLHNAEVGLMICNAKLSAYPPHPMIVRRTPSPTNPILRAIYLHTVNYIRVLETTTRVDKDDGDDATHGTDIEMNGLV